MRPLTVVNLIILGSSFAIMISLAAVIVVVLVLREDYARLQHEFIPLARSLAVFIGMTAISALSFYGLIKNQRLRYWWQALMWIGLVLTGYYYWR